MNAMRMLELKMAEPEPNGSVAQFKVAFPNDPKTYSYAAIKAAGRWYVTGRDGAIGRTWAALIELLARDNADIVQAREVTKLKDLV